MQKITKEEADEIGQLVDRVFDILEKDPEFVATILIYGPATKIITNHIIASCALSVTLKKIVEIDDSKIAKMIKESIIEACENNTPKGIH